MMEVNVAIPNFNGKEYLERLIPSLHEQGFDRIFVMDDASTDGSYEWLNEQPDVTVIKGEQNVGPTGNRNRILPHISEGIILFLDADMELLSQDIAEKLKEHFSQIPDTAVIGTLIYSKTNEPIWYNWGYEGSPKQDGIHEALEAVARNHWHDKDVMQTVKDAANGWVGHFEPIEDREVDWVIESFFAVRADVFHQMDGFDENFKRFHEGPDYCKRVKAAGHIVRFVTDIKVKHLDMQTGTDEEKIASLRESTRYWYKKHYNVPDEVIEKFFLW